jgi:anti-anti-sigma factor
MTELPALHLLHAHRHDTKNRALITLTGEIDLTSAPLVRESLAQCLRDGIRTIDIDLATVTFCDCSGLNAFLDAFLLTAEAGGYLRLHGPSPAVSRLFTLAGSGALFVEGPHVPAGLRDLPCAV